jgi:anti-sigma factor RsiW
MLSDLSAYLDGELSDARCRAIEEHLDRCPCCDQLAAGLRRAVAVCRNGGLVRLPPAVRRRARMRIAALVAGTPVPAGRRQPAR